MIRKALGLAIATAGMMAASPASAGEFLDLEPPTGVYGNLAVTCGSSAPCSFTNIFNFTTPIGADRVSVDITSTSASPETNIDFSEGSVTLNGTPLTFDLLAGVNEHGFLNNFALVAGANNVLTVSGISGGLASYAGTIAFASSVVPEPGTWMLMIVGIGAVGAALRRSRKTALRALPA